jgi:hypothetical protein
VKVRKRMSILTCQAPSCNSAGPKLLKTRNMTNVTASAISSRECLENNIGSVDGSVFEEVGEIPETIAEEEEEEEAVGV